MNMCEHRLSVGMDACTVCQITPENKLWSFDIFLKNRPPLSESAAVLQSGAREIWTPAAPSQPEARCIDNALPHPADQTSVHQQSRTAACAFIKQAGL